MLEKIRNAVILYNPASGRRRFRRLFELQQAAEVLKASGITAELTPTIGRGSAMEMAREAVKRGRELVIACGGDGTINEVVNGLAGSRVALAVLPAGTANILAKELGIPCDIPAAAGLISAGTLQRIALGAAVPAGDAGDPETLRATRYFLCVGGAGPDAAMVRVLNERLKQHTGILAYWLEGVRQFFLYRFPEFRVRVGEERIRATLVIVGRTAHYGGPFKITTGASLFEDSFELAIYTTRSRLRYLMCLPAMWAGRLRRVPGMHFLKARELDCEPVGNVRVFAHVDGEPVGPLPLHFRIVPDALTLVIPAREPPPGR